MHIKWIDRSVRRAREDRGASGGRCHRRCCCNHRFPKSSFCRRRRRRLSVDLASSTICAERSWESSNRSCPWCRTVLQGVLWQQPPPDQKKWRRGRPGSRRGEIREERGRGNRRRIRRRDSSLPLRRWFGDGDVFLLLLLLLWTEPSRSAKEEERERRSATTSDETEKNSTTSSFETQQTKRQLNI